LRDAGQFTFSSRHAGATAPGFSLGGRPSKGIVRLLDHVARALCFKPDLTESRFILLQILLQ
jgi:hypothetical protein